MINIVTYIETINDRLDNIPISTGNLIYVKDSGNHYFDSSDKTRVKIGDVIQLDTEDDRINIDSPINKKLYLVLESRRLYLYNYSWIPITSENNTTTCSIKSSDWESYTDDDNISLFKTTIQHNLSNKNIILSIYNSDYKQEIMGIKIIDKDNIELFNLEAVDCIVIIK